MLERAWADAISRRDATVINRIMADDFEGLDPAANAFTKATYLAHLKGGALAAPIEPDEIKTRFFGDTAVVVIRVKATHDRTTKVYVKRRGRWQCVASHAGGPHGVAFSDEAKVAWREGLDGWKRYGSRITADQISNCVACHTTDVHRNAPLLQPDGTMSTNRYDFFELIRPPFDCRVENVRVTVGQVVRKGDPLVELFSTDLAAAKNDYEAALLQWAHDKRIRDYKAPLARSNTLPQKELVDVESAEAQSRLKMKIAKDKLLLYGLTEQEIEDIKNEDGPRKARLWLRSRVEGAVQKVGAVPGNFYDRKDVLITITPARDDRRP
jgi:hypothetical protein